MSRDVSVIIVGAGFGGVAAAIALKRAGVRDIVVLERGDRVGGVWRANTYPGAACDVPSHLYSYSFAPNPRWSRRFSPGAEIQAYLEDVCRRFDVARHLRFDSDVESAAWDEQTGRWRVALAGGGTLESEVLVAACGQLTRPQIPALPGLDRFAGAAFHSADWDASHDFRGERVAVVGTGASAIQFVPEVAAQATHTTVFQRSAPWIAPKTDKPYRRATQTLYERVPALQRAARQACWLGMEAGVPVFTRRPPAAERVASGAFRGLATAHRHFQLRGEPALLEATRPTDAIGCKRILLSSDWYPTLRRPDVALVTATIREVVADGIVTADGVHHPADTILFGTGFTATDFLAPMQVTGREGRSLREAWAHGAEAFLGITVPAFPNMFLLYGPNTNHGVGSVLAVHEAQAGYVADAVRMLRSGAAQRLEVRRETHDAFQAELAERLGESVWATGCHSWYVNAEGRITNNWPGWLREYAQRTARVAMTDYVTAADPVAV